MFCGTHIFLYLDSTVFQLKAGGVRSMPNIVDMVFMEPGSLLGSRNSLNKGQPRCHK